MSSHSTKGEYPLHGPEWMFGAGGGTSKCALCFQHGALMFSPQVNLLSIFACLKLGAGSGGVAVGLNHPAPFSGVSSSMDISQLSPDTRLTCTASPRIFSSAGQQA